MSAIARTLSWAIRIGCTVHVIHNNVYELCETSGESMLPTLHYTGDFVHANKLARRGRNCEIGDVIIASKPTDPEQRVCKRITGMPGDYIIVDPTTADCAMIKVPDGHVWVTGDNLTHSLDSRSYGPLAMGLIKGKVFGVSNGLNFRAI
ncbi:Mitochondrial inner membrane protease subunit 1 [Wickerhamiella sorbophila]|uniref:Mitochondrial inner membrane protease subunit 1 n=1 Tax=Wickerhamiella sorbophila TaxID=45607 RepID=A0A2T0FJE8_9ASCO|nr:Mitochondrial inner membrane protease subunit 1 [Wickerhamiella sorbophila]PRT55133.1 Mitochondrial inner membrane protease subunit 1 [Wickerhamiella sorbophila]